MSQTLWALKIPKHILSPVALRVLRREKAKIRLLIIWTKWLLSFKCSASKSILSKVDNSKSIKTFWIISKIIIKTRFNHWKFVSQSKINFNIFKPFSMFKTKHRFLSSTQPSSKRFHFTVKRGSRHRHYPAESDKIGYYRNFTTKPSKTRAFRCNLVKSSLKAINQDWKCYSEYLNWQFRSTAKVITIWVERQLDKNGGRQTVKHVN